MLTREKLERGADPHYKVRTRTALDIARQLGHAHLIAILTNPPPARATALVVLECAVCRAPPGDAPLQTCSKCGIARYCSRTCQVVDWRRGHRQTCAELAQLRDASKRAIDA